MKPGSMKSFNFFVHYVKIGSLESIEISIPQVLPFKYDWNLEKVIVQICIAVDIHLKQGIICSYSDVL